MMTGNVRVDTSSFNAMIGEIARKGNVTEEEVLVSEVGKILEATIRNTKTASVTSIRATSENSEFSMQPESLYTPKSGREGVNVTKGGFIAYYLRNRYPNALWAAMSARRKTSLIAKLKARGLARKSWLDIARKLGLRIQFPGYVANAVASTGKEYPQNTRVSFQRRTGKLQINFENSQPTVNKIGGGQALQRAVDGRYKFFLRNLALGTFDSVAKIARQYPGIKVT